MIRRVIGSFAGRADEHGRELLRGSVQGFVARLLAVASVFLLNVAISRKLGASATGLFYLGIAAITALAVVARMGMDKAVLRFVAGHVSKGEWGDVAAIYRWSVGLVLVTTACGGALLYTTSRWLAIQVFDKPVLADSLVVLAPALIPLALLILHTQFLQALKMNAVALFSQTALIQTVLLAALLVLPLNWSLPAVTTAYLYAAWIALMILVVFWFRVMPQWHSGTARYDRRPVVRSSAQLFPAAFMDQVVQPWAAIVALGIWGSATDIAWFVAANRIAALASFAILPINGILAPKISAMSVEQDFAAIRRLGASAAMLMSITALPAIGFLLAVPHWAMSIFGDDFAGSGGLLLILLAGQAINVLTGPVRAMLIMTGNERLYRRASVTGGLAVVTLCVVLVPEYGGVAAAWATTAGLVITKCMAASMVVLRLHEKST